MKSEYDYEYDAIVVRRWCYRFVGTVLGITGLIVSGLAYCVLVVLMIAWIIR